MPVCSVGAPSSATPQRCWLPPWPTCVRRCLNLSTQGLCKRTWGFPFVCLAGFLLLIINKDKAFEGQTIFHNMAQFSASRRCCSTPPAPPPSARSSPTATTQRRTARASTVMPRPKPSAARSARTAQVAPPGSGTGKSAGSRPQRRSRVAAARRVSSRAPLRPLHRCLPLLCRAR